MFSSGAMPSTPCTSNRTRVATRIGAFVMVGALAACAGEPVSAQGETFKSERHSYRVVTVADGLANPWGMAFLPGGDILVTERPGRLRVIRNGKLDPQPVAGVPEVRAQGQGGLLDVVLHPNFASNRLVYLSYSKPGPKGATTAVARGRFEGNRLANVQDIFVADAWSTAGQHFGSRMVFDRNGYLYVTIGDRGNMKNGQDRSNHTANTLRLHDDGRVPKDNPFVGQSGARAEIFTYGNRNIQGMAVHPQTGQVWGNEHGPRGGDEINVLRAGRNYGWPVVTHGVNYNGSPITERTSAPGIEPPVLHWTPSIAPSGMAFYTGNAFPQWRGNVFNGALAGMHVRRVVLDGTRVVSQEKLLDGYGKRIRDVRNGPDGFLYLLVDDSRAPVLRLEPVRP